jgi:hypothetical protein
MLVPAKTRLLQPQKQSNVAWQTTPVAISPRIQAIEGETELIMHQEDQPHGQPARQQWQSKEADTSHQ